MSSIRAIWTNGQIVPAEPVDWPDGSELVVAPMPSADKIGMDPAEWQDDPESLATWIAAVEKLEPMVWLDGEREEYERYQAQVKQFNIEAVRRQMEAAPEGDGP